MVSVSTVSHGCRSSVDHMPKVRTTLPADDYANAHEDDDDTQGDYNGEVVT